MRNAEWNGRREGLCAGFRRGEGREEGDGGQKRNGGEGKRWTGTGDGNEERDGTEGEVRTNRTCSAALRHFSVATSCVVP